MPPPRCAAGIDHVKGPDAKHTQKAVDQAVVFQKGHPGIGAQQKVHPHGQHEQHQHNVLLVAIQTA